MTEQRRVAVEDELSALNTPTQFIGLDDASSFAALRSEVHKALTDIYAIPEPEGQDEEPTSKPPQPDSAIEIDSRRIALQAEELELQTALAAGKLIPIDAFTADLAVKLELLRTALLTLPGRVRLGPLTIQKARATLKAELAQAVRDVGLAAPARGN